MVFVFLGGAWTWGVPLCKIINTGMFACSWMTSGFILIIAVERYFGIVHALKQNLRSRKVIYRSMAGNHVPIQFN